MTFAERIKSESREDHEKVDNLVMSVEPFVSDDHYRKFLQLQSVFHKVVDDIYHDPVLNEKIPNLSELARYERVLADMKDLSTTEPQLSTPIPTPTGDRAIGWLYCAEGSNLGAAFLFKEVKKIHHDENHGASHLQAHPKGRAPHWREFIAYLNGLNLSEASQLEAIEGAKDAFKFYRQVVREIFQVAN